MAKKQKNSKKTKSLKAQAFYKKAEFDASIYLAGVKYVLAKKTGLSLGAKNTWCHLLDCADKATYQVTLTLKVLKHIYQFNNNSMDTLVELNANCWLTFIPKTSPNELTKLQLATPLDVHELTYCPDVRYHIPGMADTIPNEVANDNISVDETS